MSIFTENLRFIHLFFPDQNFHSGYCEILNCWPALIPLASCWYWVVASVTECPITQLFSFSLFCFLKIGHSGTNCGVQAGFECRDRYTCFCLLKPRIKGIYNQDKLVVYPTSVWTFFSYSAFYNPMFMLIISPPPLCLLIYYK